MAIVVEGVNDVVRCASHQRESLRSARRGTRCRNKGTKAPYPPPVGGVASTQAHAVVAVRSLASASVASSPLTEEEFTAANARILSGS